MGAYGGLCIVFILNRHPQAVPLNLGSSSVSGYPTYIICRRGCLTALVSQGGQVGISKLLYMLTLAELFPMVRSQWLGCLAPEQRSCHGMLVTSHRERHRATESIRLDRQRRREEVPSRCHGFALQSIMYECELGMVLAFLYIIWARRAMWNEWVYLAGMYESYCRGLPIYGIDELPPYVFSVI